MRKNRSMLLAGGLSLALTLTLTACSGEDDEAKAAQAISASLAEDTDPEFAVEQDQADCVGEGLVDRLGVDKLQEYGMLTDDLEVNDAVGEVTMAEADADSAADVFVGCVDAQAMMTEQLGADGSLTEDQQECLGEAFDDDALKQVFSLLFQGKEDEAGNALMGPALACMFG